MYVFFFIRPSPSHIYTLSLHDALPICIFDNNNGFFTHVLRLYCYQSARPVELHCIEVQPARSEEHTSELQSQFHLVCSLLLEKKQTTSFSISSLPFY